MSNTQRKVIVRRFAGELLAGYLPQAAFVREGAEIDLLDLNGRVVPLELANVRMISYVRDFNLTDTQNPERLMRRAFLARPRSEGLWVRVTLRGGDLLEGLASTDLTLLTSIVEDAGLHLVPPDTRSNTQRIFIPHTAITDLKVLAVITTPSRSKAAPHTEPSILQDSLFAPPDSPADT